MNQAGGRTADISLLGYYGIVNPVVWWLFEQRPELVVQTPAELKRPRGGRRPTCCKGGAYNQPAPKVFRYDEHGFACWLCTKCGQRYLIGDRAPKMLEPLEMDLEAELEAACDGRNRELCFDDDGRMVLYDAPAV